MPCKKTENFNLRFVLPLVSRKILYSDVAHIFRINYPMCDRDRKRCVNFVNGRKMKNGSFSFIFILPIILYAAFFNLKQLLDQKDI